MVDAAFGHWLAGFIDGEGSFTIRRDGRSPRGRVFYVPRLTIEVRADDEPMLREIHARTGAGSVHVRHPRRAKNPCATWMVQNKADCQAIVRLLDEFPLRAKKARDYAVWREAVLEWAKVLPGKTAGAHDWTRIGECKLALEDGRTFEALGEVTVVLPGAEQMALGENKWWEKAS